MKRIEKRNEPPRLREWKRNTAKFPDAHYDSHSFPVSAVNQSLVAEQGGLCGYTMIRITESTSHNEHIKPRTVSKGENPPNYKETTDYSNLIACYPNTSKSRAKCPFGADARGSTWDQSKMITPLMGDCESRFRFDLEGRIYPKNADDQMAIWTIRTLKLDHDQLDTLRRQALYDAALTPLHPNPLNARNARELAQTIRQRAPNGAFAEFCVAISQAAITYAERLEAEKEKRKFVARARARRESRK